MLSLDIGPAQIRSWLKLGLLHPRHPGVYAFGRADLSPEGELAAALLFAGHGSALSGLTALWWMSLLHRRPRRIHLDAPGRRSSREGIEISHPCRVEREWHRDLPVVPLPRALLRASERLTHNSLRLVLARADFKHLLDLPSLHSALAPGPRGTRALRAALAAHLPQLARCSNRFEVDFVLLCERFGLPLPEPNERIGRYRPDMLWPELRLIVELDGEDAHSSAAQLQADARRQAELEARGYRVLRFTWDEVQFSPERVAAAVRSAMIGA